MEFHIGMKKVCCQTRRRDPHVVAGHRPGHRHQHGAFRPRPKHVVKTGKTAVLDADQARKLLDSIDTTTVIRLRDPALVSVMTFAGDGLKARLAGHDSRSAPHDRRGFRCPQEFGQPAQALQLRLGGFGQRCFLERDIAALGAGTARLFATIIAAFIQTWSGTSQLPIDKRLLQGNV